MSEVPRSLQEEAPRYSRIADCLLLGLKDCRDGIGITQPYPRFLKTAAVCNARDDGTPSGGMWKYLLRFLGIFPGHEYTCT